MDHEAIEEKGLAVYTVSWLDMQRRRHLVCWNAHVYGLSAYLHCPLWQWRWRQQVIPKRQKRSSQPDGTKKNRFDRPLHITNSLTVFFLDLLTLEDGTNRLPRNVGKELPLYAA